MRCVQSRLERRSHAQQTFAFGRVGMVCELSGQLVHPLFGLGEQRLRGRQQFPGRRGRGCRLGGLPSADRHAPLRLRQVIGDSCVGWKIFHGTKTNRAGFAYLEMFGQIVCAVEPAGVFEPADGFAQGLGGRSGRGCGGLDGRARLLSLFGCSCEGLGLQRQSFVEIG